MLSNFNESAFEELFIKSSSAFAKFNKITACDFGIAGEKIRLVFSDDKSIPEFIRPLSHLLTPTCSNPDFTLYIMEDDNSPIHRYKADLFPRSGEVPYLCGENNHVCFYWNQYAQAYAMHILDFKKSKGYFWKNIRLETSMWDLLSPLRMFFHSYFIRKDKVMLHAGAIGFEDKGLLLVGKGGSGKSNTVLSCIDGELLILSDDYLILEKNYPVIAYSLYSDAKFKMEDINRMPFLINYYDKKISSASYKAVTFLNEVIPKKLMKSTEIKAILAPKISDHTLIKSIPKHQVLNSVLPSTIMQIPQSIEKVISVTRNAVDLLPCYQLCLGKNYREVVEVMSKFLSAI